MNFAGARSKRKSVKRIHTTVKLTGPRKAGDDVDGCYFVVIYLLRPKGRYLIIQRPFYLKPRQIYGSGARTGIGWIKIAFITRHLNMECAILHSPIYSAKLHDRGYLQQVINYPCHSRLFANKMAYCVPYLDLP